jgi:hypothetical protein
MPPARLDKTYAFKLLHRFSAQGDPVGCPIDLASLSEVKDVISTHGFQPNWEAMAWFEPGKSLILVNDKPPATPIAVIIELPDDWR